MTSQTLCSISGHLSTTHQDKLKESLEKSLINSAKDDLGSVYYFAKGYSLLKKQVPAELSKDACNRITNVWTQSTTPENTFYIVSTWNLLACPEKMNTKEISDVSKVVKLLH